MSEPTHQTESRTSEQSLDHHPLDSSDSQIGVSMSPPPLQLAADDGPKPVTGTAMTRLGFAQDAIDYTKGILKHGAGNQIEALQASRFNSNYRLHVARKEKYWDLTPEAKLLADADKNAYRAARAEMAEGGNCGEHANLAFQYLRHKAVGEEISRGKVDGFDHAFTFVGPAGAAKDMSQTAVSDPWPTAPKAVLWEDHFAKPVMDGGSPLIVNSSMVADGGNPKDLIKAGLTLSAQGQAIINHKLTQEQTDDKIEKHEDERAEKAVLQQEMKDISDAFKILKGQYDGGAFAGQEKTDKEAEMKQMAVDFRQKRDRLKEIKIWMWGQEDAHEPGRDFDYEQIAEPTWIEQTLDWMASWF